MTLVKKGFNIRIYPNKEQTIKLCSTFGCVRWLWNHFLDMSNQRYDFSPESKFLSTYSLNYILTQVKQEFPWLKDVDATALTSVTDNLSSSFRNFFDGRCRHPRFKAKKHEQSYTSKCVNNNIWVVDEHHIRLPKIGTVYYRGTMPQGKVKRATVRLKPDGRILVSVLCEVEIETKQLTSKKCGADLGLHDLVVLSDGTKEPLFRYDKDLEDKLIYWQRLAARRLLKAKEVMNSDSTKTLDDFKNYQKARTMVAKYHAKISQQRTDYLHRITTWLVTNYDVIVVEDLKVKNMMHNHKLARAIGNASWFELVRMLEYKCAWYGKKFIKVDPSYTSQACHCCGTVNNRLNLSPYKWLKIREWTCPECGEHHDRDVNAAINILNRGLALEM